MDGNYTMKDFNFGNDVHFMNSVPTLILDQNVKFLVYSKCSEDDHGPTTYFYDLQESKTLCRIKGAEVFIDYYPNRDKPEEAGNVLYLTSKKLLERDQWKKPI